MNDKAQPPAVILTAPDSNSARWLFTCSMWNMSLARWSSPQISIFALAPPPDLALIVPIKQPITCCCRRRSRRKALLFFLGVVVCWRSWAPDEGNCGELERTRPNLTAGAGRRVVL